MKLTNEQIEKLKKFFSNEPVERAYIFGSFARGDADMKSDIDILVELDYTKHIGLRFGGMLMELQDLLNNKVDLVSSNGVSKHIKPYIEKDKVLIYERQHK